MASYHSHHNDGPFSPKKYATVSALKDAEAGGYHSHAEDEDRDKMYNLEKKYGANEENPFESDYLKRNEDEKEEKKKLKPTGVEEKLDQQEKYKPAGNDEIAEVLFSRNKGQMPFSEIENISNETENSEKNAEKKEKKKSVEDILGDLPWKKK